VVLPLPTSAIAEKNSQEEAVVEFPLVYTLEKIMKASAIKHRKKATHTASVSLEAHQDTFSLSDVSTPRALFFMMYIALLMHVHSAAFDAEISISWR
jgi:hypothetical protein